VPPKEPEKVCYTSLQLGLLLGDGGSGDRTCSTKKLHGKALKGWYRSLTGALRVTGKADRQFVSRASVAPMLRLSLRQQWLLRWLLPKATTDNNSVIGDTMPIISGPMQGAAARDDQEVPRRWQSC